MAEELLLKQFCDLCPQFAPMLPRIVELQPVRLRGHRSPVGAWEDRFRKLKDSIWFLEISMADESVCSGTAFKIDDDILATAGHILVHGDIAAGLDHELSTVKYRIRNEDKGVDVGLLRPSPGQIFKGQAMSSECRLPEIGEQVAAMGFPSQPCRDTSLSLSVGLVESLPVNQKKDCRFIQVSFQSAGGLSGAPLIDRGGHVLGIVVGNAETPVPRDCGLVTRSFAQVIPFEYLYDLRHGHRDFAQDDSQQQ